MVMLFLALLCVTAYAQDDYTVIKSRLSLEIPYSLGKHKAKSDNISGNLSWDPEGKSVTQAEFSLRAETLKIKDQKLKCHLLESLTLDYEKSDFPADHVCEDNILPASGKNSPAYPLISAKLLSPVKPGEEARLEWSIHGKTHAENIPLTIALDNGAKTMTVKAKWKLRRSDFGIIVKKFLFIDADDSIPLELTMTLEKKK